MSLYVTVWHCMSLYVTVCHCISLYVTVCHCMSLYVTGVIFQEKLESNTTYYGSDGSSCPQSDETYSSNSSGPAAPGRVLQQYTGWSL